MPGFYTENAARAYPLDDALPLPALTLEPGGAAVALPSPTLVECLALLGPAVGVDPARTPVYLASIARSAGVLAFALGCGTAPAAVHYRSVSDGAWATSTVTESMASAACGSAFGWRTTLVTGDLAPLLAALPDGATLAGGPGLAMLPTLAQSCRDDWVSSISVANESRLIAAPPGGPPPPLTRSDLAQAACLTGAVSLSPGYNATVDVDAATATLTVGGSVGAGLGEPCGEVPAYPGEPTPAGSPYLSGGPGCDTLILSINGLTGPALNLVGGLGVIVSNDPNDPHGLVVDLTG